MLSFTSKKFNAACPQRMTFCKLELVKLNLSGGGKMLCPHYHDDVVVWFRKLSSRLPKHFRIFVKRTIFSPLIASADSCSFLFLLSSSSSSLFFKMTVISCDLSSSGHQRLCVGCVRVCAGVCRCARVCVGVRGYAQKCKGV